VTAGGVPSTVVSPYYLRQVKSDLRIYPRSVLRLLLFVDDHTRLGLRRRSPRPLRMAAFASGTL
jgi:hypothetical protein